VLVEKIRKIVVVGFYKNGNHLKPKEVGDITGYFIQMGLKQKLKN